MPKWLRIILAIIVFWVCFFIGGAIVWLVHRLYEAMFVPQGNLIDSIIQILSNAVGIAVGAWLFWLITEGKANKVLLVNAILAAIVAIVILVSVCIRGATWQVIVSDVLSVIATLCVVFVGTVPDEGD